ncbi:MAG TPA: TonB-dependent receptor [Bacteroidales bacterium]|nr:TonB-dependent receptor [Bacteroidales bacterium]
MKKTTTLLLLIFLSISAFAQKSVQGKVQDKKDEGSIESATIRLLNAKDSSLIQGCFTDSKGEFSLSRIKNGNYIIEVRFLGYTNATRSFSVMDKNVLLKPIYLSESQKNLKEVVVSGMAAQMAVKGDTIEYNPAAFKLADNAVVEDLLKKLPGVQVDAAGKVTVNGEEIKKVRVDGKKFFDSDPTMATKNFTVDMVDKIQVIDQKSEMSQLTGFEDDNTERIINLTIKQNRKKGVFGNVGAGAGADKDGGLRYDANTFLTMMRGESMTTLTGGANNVNKMRSGRGRGGISGGGSGLIESQNIGVNNNTEVSKTLKIGGDGSYNHLTNTSESSSERENYLNGETRSTNSQSLSVRENNQANLRLEMEWALDTLTTMIVQPSLGYSNSNSNSESNNINFSDGDSISWGKSNSNSLTNGIDGGLRFIFNRKSAVKKGRTFTLNVGGTLSNSNSDGHNFTEKNTFADTTKINQRTENKSNSYNVDVRASFVEPLWNLRNFLEVAGTFSTNSTNSNKFLYNDLNNDGNFTDIDSTYSNEFTRNFYRESLELNYRHQAASYNYMVGVKAEPAQTYSTTNYLNSLAVNRPNEVLNFAPSGQFRYNFGRKQFARLEYRGRTEQPSIDQMQPLKTNNPMYVSTGNPSLSPSFTHNMNLMYSSFNQEHLSSFSLGLNGSYTLDALVNNSIYDETGKQYNQTVNAVDAPFSANANIMFNTPIIQKRLQFSTQTSGRYQQRFGYSDLISGSSVFDANDNLLMGKLSNTVSKGFNENINLTFTTDMVELGVRGSVNYNTTRNNLNANKNQETWDYVYTANLNLRLPYSWTISNDMSYTTRQGYSEYSKDEWVWNASIDKSVFKKQGTISLRLNDILQQKLSVFENIGDNYRTLNRSKILTSYFIVSFTYRIARFGGGAGAGDMFRGGDRGMRRGGGMFDN